MTSPLTQLAAARRSNLPFGITSVCSAHPLVVRAAIRRALRDDADVLIEATCNQVNQFGGYTGMTPERFARFVFDIAADEGLEQSRIILGGDHLGPNPWRKESAVAAMEKAGDMVEAYIEAGFTKIHLDASMGCAGEPPALDDEHNAVRAAGLAARAERAACAAGGPKPVYIIGTEVPVPGGADHVLDTLRPTDAAAARKTIAVHREVFAARGLSAAFERVIALVVQPGVEFGSGNVIAYRPELSGALTALLDEEPQFVFEAHSTDYQSRDALAALVRNGFPILKVGPGLTFALREAAYGLDLIAGELVAGYGERRLARTMESVMLGAPQDWQGHYHGGETDLRLQRHYSYSDRIRYYWGRPEADAAMDALLSALRGRPVPETLMRQFLPQLPPSLGRAGRPEDILIAAVDSVLADYAHASGRVR